mgnify:CR=1 FL=1
MNSKISEKDKKSWEEFLSNDQKLPNKDNFQTEIKSKKTRSLDLHGQTLDEANRQTNLSKSSIVFQCPELLLDCRPLESSYVWMGVGIVDRRLRQMPELGLLLEESRQLVLRRLRYNCIGFNLVDQLRVKTGGRILELTRPSHGRIGNIPAPDLLVPTDLELYKQEGSPIRQKPTKAETVTEVVPCLVWDHEVEKLKKLAQGLEQGGYIESAEI